MTEPLQAYSVERLTLLRSGLEPAEALLAGHPLSVYVTGSYGRLEAWSGSDLDVFFLHERSEEEGSFPYTTFIKLSAALIDAAAHLNFPAFSGDGRYLEVQYVGQMERVLGSPQDDSLNAFTARMLLLLESRPLLNDATYESLLARIIGFYFRDYEDNRDSFLPMVLLNDILRFWRTLTLNYEHHRLKLGVLTGDELEAKKADSALKNYKLKISRLATCFSMVAHLSSVPVPVTPEQVLALCHDTPAQRFEALRALSGAGEFIDDLQERYANFLDVTQRDAAATQEHFADPIRRKAALADAAGYGDAIYALLQAITPDDRMRYLVI